MSFWSDVGKSTWKWAKIGMLVGAAVGCFIAGAGVLAVLGAATHIGVGLVVTATVAATVITGFSAIKGGLLGGALGASLGSVKHVFSALGNHDTSPAPQLQPSPQPVVSPAMEPEMATTRYQDAVMASRQQQTGVSPSQG